MWLKCNCKQFRERKKIWTGPDRDPQVVRHWVYTRSSNIFNRETSHNLYSRRWEQIAVFLVKLYRYTYYSNVLHARVYRASYNVDD